MPQLPKRVKKLIVAYKLRPVFVPPDPAVAPSETRPLSPEPYTHTFAEVTIGDFAEKGARTWLYRDPGSGKPPVAMAVASYLLERFPNAWPAAMIPRRLRNVPPPEGVPPPGNFDVVMFFGLYLGVFFDVLATDCSIFASTTEAEDPVQLPCSMWRDKQYQVNLCADEDDAAERMRRSIQAHKLQGFNGWEPGQDVKSDFSLVLAMGASLGLFKDEWVLED